MKTLSASPPTKAYFNNESTSGTTPLPAAGSFIFFKHWTVVEILNRVGLSRLLALNVQKSVRQSAGVVTLALDQRDDHGFIQAGRAMQRFWLEANRLGLSVQPITGLPLLIQRFKAGELSKIQKKHQQILKQVITTLSEHLGLDGESIVMLFRIGTSAPPSARSLRLRQN